MWLLTISATPQIASTNIKVYKIIEKKHFNLYYTPYMDVLLKEYSSVLELKDALSHIIKTYTQILPCTNCIRFCVTDEGIHCFADLSRAKDNITNSKIYSIIKGTIPKGTKYWVSTDGTEIVSRYIKFEVSKFQRFVMYIRYWYLYLYKYIFKE